jgi:hypothetical protein
MEANWEGRRPPPGHGHAIKDRLTFRNETHGIATMTLIDLKVTDTGQYRCEGSISYFGQTRFVYVSSGLFLFWNLKHCDLSLQFIFLGFRIQVPQNLFWWKMEITMLIPCHKTKLYMSYTAIVAPSLSLQLIRTSAFHFSSSKGNGIRTSRYFEIITSKKACNKTRQYDTKKPFQIVSPVWKRPFD